MHETRLLRMSFGSGVEETALSSPLFQISAFTVSTSFGMSTA
jgi:hypothetical protein